LNRLLPHESQKTLVGLHNSTRVVSAMHYCSISGRIKGRYSDHTILAHVTVTLVFYLRIIPRPKISRHTSPVDVVVLALLTALGLAAPTGCPASTMIATENAANRMLENLLLTVGFLPSRLRVLLFFPTHRTSAL
jgi:hypothetical protein